MPTIPEDRDFANYVTESLPDFPAIETALLAVNDAEPQTPSKAKTPPASAQIVALAQAKYDVGQTFTGEPFLLEKGGHVVRVFSTKKSPLRAELAAAYFDATGRPASGEQLGDALAVLAGLAARTAPVPVALRVAREGGVTWLDLADTANSVVRIDGDGWRLLDPGEACPVLFRRTVASGPFPTPERGGTTSELWQFVNAAEADRPLLLAWLAAALADPEIPHAALNLLGEAGSGKTTAAMRLVALADPSPAAIRTPPRSLDDFAVTAQASYVLAFDNVSHLGSEFADTLCRCVTGSADIRRELFADDGLKLFAVKRCLILNGIDFGNLRADLADRSLFVGLEPLADDRKGETELEAAWRDAYPRIFGAILDEVSKVLAGRETVAREHWPRMLDFARIVATLDDQNGTDGLGRSYEHAETIAIEVLESDPLAAAITSHLRREFSGTAGQLLAALAAQVGPEKTREKGWPTSPRAAAGAIKRAAPALRKCGYRVSEAKDPHTKTNKWTISPPPEKTETFGCADCGVKLDPEKITEHQH